MLQAVRMSCADADRRGSMPRVLVDLPTGNRRTQRPFLLKTTRLAMMTRPPAMAHQPAGRIFSW